MDNTIALRSIYEKAKEIFAQQGVDASRAILTQSKLRAERQLNTSTNQYTFSFLQQDGVPSFATEVKLNQAYAALVYGLGFFLAEPASASDTAFPLYTFPDPGVFTGTGEADALEQVYNGSINLKIGGQDILVNHPMEIFRTVPQTQKGSPVNTGGVLDTQVDMKHAFIPVEPNIILYGTWKVDWTLVLPAALSAVGDNTRAVFIARILLAQNASLIGR
ncbi:MAG: hypothetical protein K6T57_16325 [Thermaceae bacterium]|nr:hypothetical protein [Thermaceae bacterium]